MSQLIHALSHLSEVRLPSLPLLSGEDRDKWVPVVCIAGYCILTLADWFAR